MNQPFRSLHKVFGAILGLAFSLLVLIPTPAMSAPAHAFGVIASSTSSTQLAAATGRIKAGAKKVEGTTQEAIGNVTGNQGDRLAGKAKRAEANVRNGIEDAKDKTGLG